jgi:hypothetical protein
MSLVFILLGPSRANFHLLACEAPSSRLRSTLSGNKSACHDTIQELLEPDIGPFSNRQARVDRIRIRIQVFRRK